MNIKDKSLYLELMLASAWSFAAGLFAFNAYQQLSLGHIPSFILASVVLTLDLACAWKSAKPVIEHMKGHATHGAHPRR